MYKYVYCTYNLYTYLYTKYFNMLRILTNECKEMFSYDPNVDFKMFIYHQMLTRKCFKISKC